MCERAATAPSRSDFTIGQICGILGVSGESELVRNELDRATNDPYRAVDRGLGDPVESVASIICQPKDLFDVDSRLASQLRKRQGRRLGPPNYGPDKPAHRYRKCRCGQVFDMHGPEEVLDRVKALIDRIADSKS
jgi:hypothetical protein